MLRGVLGGIEWGWFQRRIADSAFEHARQVESGERVIVGVNRFTDGSEGPPAAAALAVGVGAVGLDDAAAVEEGQRQRLAAVRAGRDEAAVTAVLARVADDARRPDVNLMPVLVDAVRAYATEGEIVGALAGVFGEWAPA